MSEEDNLSDISEDLSDIDLEDEDLDAIEAELRELGDEEDDEIDLDSEEDCEYTEEELKKLEQEVAEMEEEMGEITPEAREETGNLIIGALQRPRYAHLMENLEQELEEEAKKSKQRMRDVIPKYMVNPFALPNRIDYEEIFDEIDPEEPDLKVWIIDSFEPVPIPLNQIGKFHSGDAYVLLYITEECEGGIVINIHHWIGEQASVDKYGAAAFRAVELNMYMGGRCHIFRELEGRESKTFVDYFEGDIEYLVGACTKESFRHVTPNQPRVHKPNLYQLIPQSAGHIVMKLVRLHWETLDSSFIFLLDAGNRIFMWCGYYTEPKHRHRALAHPYTIRSNERSGDAEVLVFIEGKPEEELKYEEDIFWRYLEGRKPAPNPNDDPPVPKIAKRFVFEQEDAEEFDFDVLAVSVVGSWDNFYQPVPMVKSGDAYDLEIPLPAGTYQYQYKVATSSGIKPYCDVVRETTTSHIGQVNVVKAVIDNDQYYSLWGTTNTNGKLALKEIEFEELDRSLLTSENAYILDCTSELFVWVGLYCKPLEKQVALAIAKKIYQKFERPDWTPILGVYETAELTTFTSKFISWDHLITRRRSHETKKTKKNPNPVRFTLSSMINVESLLREPDVLPDTMIDNGSGSVEVRLFTLQDGAAQNAIPPFATGVFFTESSYIVLYKYDEEVRGRMIKKFIVYFWSGLGCKNADAVFAKFNLGFFKMLLGRVGPYRISGIRVRQGKEPKHFMRLFDGRIIIKQGAQNTHSKFFNETALYDVVISSHIVGYPRTHVIEVDRKCSSLVSVRCFLLFTKSQIYLWVGQYSYPEEKDMSLSAFRAIQRSKYQMPCSSSPKCILQDDSDDSNDVKEFFSLLEGSESDVCTLQSCGGRLYAITAENAFFEIYEIIDYVQYDLLLHTNAILLLQTRNTLFLWQGADAIDSLLQKALPVAHHWIDSVVELRGGDVEPQKLSLQKQGEETGEFKVFFPGWHHNYVRDFDTVKAEREKKLKTKELKEIGVRALEKEYSVLQDKMELLELISSSPEYSKAEEKAFNPKFNVVSVSFDNELIALGLLPPPAAPTIDKLARFKESVEPGEIMFHWKTPALAVAVKGSWNDWQQIPMINLGKDGFVVRVKMDPGRFYCKFLVASSEGAISATVDDFPTTTIKIDGEEETVNIIRMYLCTHPTYLEKQRKLKEDAEEAKRKAEEEANKELTVEELKRIQREAKEQQRIANEERLRRQLEEKRKNRRHPTFTETAVEEPTEKEKKKSSIDSTFMERSRTRNTTRARPSLLDDKSIRSSTASRNSPKKDDTSLAYSRTLLNNLGSSSRKSTRTYKPSTEISSKFNEADELEAKRSYREKRRAELGIGTNSSRVTTKDPEPTTNTSRASSLLERLDEKLTVDSPSRRSRNSSTSGKISADTLEDSIAVTTRRASRYSSNSTDTTPTRSSRYSSHSVDSPTRRSSRYSDSTDTTPTRSSRYSSDNVDSPTRSSRYSSDSTETTPTRSSRYSSDSVDSPTRRSSRNSESTETTPTRSSSRYSSDVNSTPTRSSRYSSDRSTDTTKTPSQKEGTSDSDERARKRAERRKALGLA